MIDVDDYYEDIAAIVEPVLDIDEGIYWEVDWEYYFSEGN